MQGLCNLLPNFDCGHRPTDLVNTGRPMEDLRLNGGRPALEWKLA